MRIRRKNLQFPSFNQSSCGNKLIARGIREHSDTIFQSLLLLFFIREMRSSATCRAELRVVSLGNKTYSSNYRFPQTDSIRSERSQTRTATGSLIKSPASYRLHYAILISESTLSQCGHFLAVRLSRLRCVCLWRDRFDDVA